MNFIRVLNTLDPDHASWCLVTVSGVWFILGAKGWSAVGDCGISWSFSLVFWPFVGPNQGPNCLQKKYQQKTLGDKELNGHLDESLIFDTLLVFLTEIFEKV